MSGVVMVEHTDAAVAAEPPALVEAEEKGAPAVKKTTTVAATAAAAATADCDEMKPANKEEAVEERIKSEDTTLSTTRTPQALNIVSIGSSEDAYAFTFHDDKLQEILDRVPSHAKVAVVSVVGAFRTGKSFLLSWFLRYLHNMQQQQQKQGTASSSSRDNNNNMPWYEQVETLERNQGFHWKAGSERYTTGIWMWSHPYILERPNDDDADSAPLAVLLVDTQGMFDNETTMNLTASIFGLSTLLSSYLIYNVDKRIQEDNLQQLALFSEFAKVAVESDNDNDNNNNKAESSGETSSQEETPSASSLSPKPFQRIEFLVRDWPHFEDHDDDKEEDHEETPDFHRMEQMMEDYLQKAIADRDAKDLQATREQIVSCFEDITCYGFCHPGFAVEKKRFTGDVDQIETLFLQLLDRFCHRVFDIEHMPAKKIHDRELTAVELGAYIRAYAALFASGAKFPTAATLLEATASANNTNAVRLAMETLRVEADRVVGPKCSNYLKPEEFEEEIQRIRKKSLEEFRSRANFGSKKMIEESCKKLLAEQETRLEIYRSLNEERNPLRGLGM